jgi:hypothetical protein
LATPAIKVKLELHIRGGLTNSKPAGPIMVIDQSKILSGSQAQFITLFLEGVQLCCAFYHPWQAARIWCGKN